MSNLDKKLQMAYFRIFLLIKPSKKRKEEMEEVAQLIDIIVSLRVKEILAKK